MISLDNCKQIALSAENRISGFDCGNDDLNEFFNEDAIKRTNSDEPLRTRLMFYDMMLWKKKLAV